MSKQKDLVHSFGGPSHTEWPHCSGLLVGCWMAVVGVGSGAQLLAYFTSQGTKKKLHSPSGSDTHELPLDLPQGSTTFYNALLGTKPETHRSLGDIQDLN